MPAYKNSSDRVGTVKKKIILGYCIALIASIMINLIKLKSIPLSHNGLTSWLGIPKRERKLMLLLLTKSIFQFRSCRRDLGFKSANLSAPFVFLQVMAFKNKVQSLVVLHEVISSSPNMLLHPHKGISLHVYL